MFTKFWDMDSGGRLKEQWDIIYIEASKGEACEIFEKRFGHAPDHVTCSCCGDDYAILESETLESATKFHRKTTPLDKYLEENKERILVLYKDDIKNI